MKRGEAAGAGEPHAQEPHVQGATSQHEPKAWKSAHHHQAFLLSGADSLKFRETRKRGVVYSVFLGSDRTLNHFFPPVLTRVHRYHPSQSPMWWYSGGLLLKKKGLGEKKKDLVQK